ncbi:LysR family transcriptional regulator [Actinocatenispora thailandica]|uniref:LysR family transcriptional regulator n=2 Tax=Actinocatenispora thailandica TaxID=227318 RepID=A0A7R7HXL5_9ACTN|nr:LysR family transcriptional regulator [Actinocatenispora thailandica]
MASLTPWVTFCEACRAGSLSAAAETLGYTQSAVSRQIAALERDLGTALLVREPRGVRPTPAGAAVLPHARLLVAEADRAARAAAAPGPAPHVSVGAVQSAAMALVPDALRRVPDPPSWTMLTDSTARLIDRVAGGELDLAVVTDAPPGLPKSRDVRLRHLFADPMSVVVPGDHRLARRRRVSIADLADECWIEDNAGSEALLHQLAARYDLTLQVDRGVGALMIKVALVAAGHGVALVPRSLGAALRPDVRLLALRDAPRRGVYVATRPGRDDLDRLVAALRTHR